MEVKRAAKKSAAKPKAAPEALPEDAGPLSDRENAVVENLDLSLPSPAASANELENPADHGRGRGRGRGGCGGKGPAVKKRPASASGKGGPSKRPASAEHAVPAASMNDQNEAASGAPHPPPDAPRAAPDEHEAEVALRGGNSARLYADISLGCPKCRNSRVGCATCRKANGLWLTNSCLAAVFSIDDV